MKMCAHRQMAAVRWCVCACACVCVPPPPGINARAPPSHSAVVASSPLGSTRDAFILQSLFLLLLFLLSWNMVSDLQKHGGWPSHRFKARACLSHSSHLCCAFYLFNKFRINLIDWSAVMKTVSWLVHEDKYHVQLFWATFKWIILYTVLYIYVLIRKSGYLSIREGLMETMMQIFFYPWH